MAQLEVEHDLAVHVADCAPVALLGRGGVVGVAHAGWRGLLAGSSGVSTITRFDTTGYPVRIAAEVKGFEPGDWIAIEGTALAGLTTLALPRAGMRRSQNGKLQHAAIGVGGMGWADMLVRVGLPYDSKDGVEMGRRGMEFLKLWKPLPCVAVRFVHALHW